MRSNRKDKRVAGRDERKPTESNEAKNDHKKLVIVDVEDLAGGSIDESKPIQLPELD